MELERPCNWLPVCLMSVWSLSCSEPKTLTIEPSPSADVSDDTGIFEAEPPDDGSSDDDVPSPPDDTGDPSDTSPPAQDLGPDPTEQSTGGPGIYTVEDYGEDQGLRDGPDYDGATVYYPTDAEPPFASVIIVPGYLSPEDWISAWGPFYASHGIVAMTIGTNSVFDDPTQRAAALLDAKESLLAENTRNGSPLEGALNPQAVVVSGWSMGGGGAQEAAEDDPSLAGVIGLCPFGEVSGYRHNSPLLVIGGQFDTVAPVGFHGFLHYTNSTTPQKLYYEVVFGDHWVANDPASRDGDIGRMGLSWVRVFAMQDDRYRQFLLTAPNSASQFTSTL